MAVHKGSSGTIHIGTNAIAEITSYSFEQTAETIESTSLGDTSRTYEVGISSWSGTVDCYLDETDTAQQALTIGSSVTVKFYYEGTTSGDTYWTGTGLVTSYSRTSDNDSLVSASVSIQGTGALTSATV